MPAHIICIPRAPFEKSTAQKTGRRAFSATAKKILRWKRRTDSEIPNFRTVLFGIVRLQYDCALVLVGDEREKLAGRLRVNHGDAALEIDIIRNPDSARGDVALDAASRTQLHAFVSLYRARNVAGNDYRFCFHGSDGAQRA